MNDKCFIDTNILIYAYSIDEPAKKEMAESVVLNDSSIVILSTQVINELINVLRKKKDMHSDQLIEGRLLIKNPFYKK